MNIGFGLGLVHAAVSSAVRTVVIPWILRTGFWADVSPWDDTQLWKDS